MISAVKMETIYLLKNSALERCRERILSAAKKRKNGESADNCPFQEAEITSSLKRRHGL